MGIKFIHDSLSDYFAGGHLKRTVEENPGWQALLDSLVWDKDAYGRWRSAFGQLSEMASGKQVDELIGWGESWRQRLNLFGLDWLPRLYLSRKRYDELEKILTDLVFIEQKCTAGMTHDLVEDYNRLGVGRMQPSPPIRTSWCWEGRLGVWCPFCLAWSQIKENQLGKVTECPVCQMTLSINSFTIDAMWQACGPKRIVPKQKPVTAKLPQAVSDFADFVKSEAHSLEEYPNLTFQQAANQPNHTAPAHAAAKRQHAGQEKRTWFHQIDGHPRQGVCLMTLRGHGWAVNDCSFSPDGSIIASASDNGILILWSASTGAKLARLFGPPKCHMPEWCNPCEDLKSCAFSPDGSRIVSASKKGTMILWDTATGECLATYESPSGSPTWSFSPDGLHIVLAIPNQRAQLVDLSTGTTMRTIPSDEFDYAISGLHIWGVKGMLKFGNYIFNKAWDLRATPELKKSLERYEYSFGYTFSPDRTQVLVSTREGLKLLDVLTGRELASLTKGYVPCVFSPDGSKIILASSGLQVLVYDTLNGELTLELDAHSDRINAFSFSPDGSRLVSASDDKTLSLWDVSAPTESTPKIEGSNEFVNFSITPSGRWTGLSLSQGRKFSGTGKLRASDNSKQVSVVGLEDCPYGWPCNILFSDETAKSVSHIVDLKHMFFSPGGRYLVSVYDRMPPFDTETNVYDTSSGSLNLITLLPACGPVAFSADDTQAVFTSKDRTIRLWDMSASTELMTLGKVDSLLNSISFSPDGTMIACQCKDNCLWLFDTRTGAELSRLRGYSKRLFCRYIFSPDCSLIASISQDSTVRLWNPRTGDQLAQLTNHARSRSGCFFSPDGSLLVAALVDNTLRIWNVVTGVEEATLRGHLDRVNMCAFSPDGLQIVSASKDETVRLWDASTGYNLKTLKSFPHRFSFCTFSPDGVYILSTSERACIVWDMLTGIEVARLTEYSKNFCEWRYLLNPFGIISVSRDDRFLHKDKDVKFTLWDFTSGAKVAIYSHIGGRLGWSSRSRRLAFASGAGQLHLLKLENEPKKSPIVTAVRLWLFGKDRPDDKLTALCVWCGRRFEVKENKLGEEVNCLYCGKPLKLNPFKAEPPPQ